MPSSGSRRYCRRVGALRETEVDECAGCEPKLLVERAGAVLLLDVQERQLAFVEDVVDERCNERAPVAVAPWGGVCADGADLGVAVELQPLAGHCGELAVDLDAEVAA